MSLTADSLKNNEVQKRAVSREVKMVLAQIDDELKVAHSSGKHHAIVPAPITFSVPYMTGADSQRCIYFKILSDLIRRGFTVKINMKKDSTLFIVSWLSDDERKNLAEQNAIIAKYTVKDMKTVDLQLRNLNLDDLDGVKKKK
jgi:hypothetical protein